MLDKIIELLGFGAEHLALNKAAGLFNYTLLVPALVWLLQHHADPITFTLDLGSIVAIVFIAFVWLEFNRRT